jgi:tRNA A37 N6-isopentenylltransferase MiaA
MRCVGYRQAWQFLDEVASLGAKGPEPLASRRQRFIDEAVAATRQLAKRQLKCCSLGNLGTLCWFRWC